MNNIKLKNFVEPASNAHRFINASCVLANVYRRLPHKKVANSNPDDDGDSSPSPQTLLAA